MSYYEKRIAELEARVEQLAREQRMKAIPVEAKLLERYALMQADNTRLKAEVERLRKAGDALANEYIMDEVKKSRKPILGSWVLTPAIEAWNAAKEGKPGA